MTDSSERSKTQLYKNYIVYSFPPSILTVYGAKYLHFTYLNTWEKALERTNNFV